MMLLRHHGCCTRLYFLGSLTVPYPQHPHDSKVTPPHTEFLMGSSQPNVRSIQPNRQTTFFFMGGVGIHVHPAFQNSRLTSFLLLSISGIFHAGKRGRPTLQMECSIVSRHFHCRVALPHGIFLSPKRIWNPPAMNRGFCGSTLGFAYKGYTFPAQIMVTRKTEYTHLASNQTAFRNGKLFSRVPGHRARQPHVRVYRQVQHPVTCSDVTAWSRDAFCV